MGEDNDPTQRLPETVPSGTPVAPCPAGPAPADAFASTLTVAPGTPAPAPRPEPGRELGPVRLVREIGRGATGCVFHAHHTVLGRAVAVKFLMNVTAGGGEGLKRFVDEARAAASVRHPNLTQVFHADVDGGTPFLVLEYVQGPTLRQLLEHAGPLGTPVTAAVMNDVAAAVAELHARGIIHRDIKPSNVLVDKDGRVCVTDFGLAVRRSHPAAGPGASPDTDFAGTPAYMAPEMFEGRVSARSDVYAMGVMAFHLLAGATPFAGAFHELRERHAHEALPSALLRERGVPAEVVEVIERATNKQAMFRYKAAPDFARALREAAKCGVPELARARKQLCDIVAGRAGAAAEGGAGSAPTSTGEVRGPAHPSPGRADDSDSTLYTQTISRIATIKREKRRHAPAEPAGWSANLPKSLAETVASGPSSAPALAASPVAPTPAIVPAPVSLAGASDSSDTAAIGPVHSQPPPPASALVVSVLAIAYGSLVALWLVGVVGRVGRLGPPVPPVSGATTPMAIVLLLAALMYFVLAVLLVPAAVACLRLKHWGRRLMLSCAAADIALQLATLLLVVAWVEPAMVNDLLSRANAPTADARAALQASILWPWAAQWFVLSLFPAAVLRVMTRPAVRAAFDSAAPPPAPAGEFYPAPF
jgi:hypothetical protein